MKVTIYTDGACSGNPGVGGYCAILKCGQAEKIISGSEQHTTNNRMELTSVIEGLKALRHPCDVDIVTDSKYVCDAVNRGWLSDWKQNGWTKKNRKPVLNIDLWMELDSQIKTHNITFKWIKGHSGHIENERCDKIAVSEYLKLK